MDVLCFDRSYCPVESIALLRRQSQATFSAELAHFVPTPHNNKARSGFHFFLGNHSNDKEPNVHQFLNRQPVSILKMSSLPKYRLMRPLRYLINLNYCAPYHI